jgi:hypothetical protein
MWHRLPDAAYKQLDPKVVARYARFFLPAKMLRSGSSTATQHSETTARG